MAPRPVQLRRLTSTVPLLEDREGLQRGRSSSIESADSDMSVESKDGAVAAGEINAQLAQSLHDAERDGELTLLEKKCVLINAEIDSHGMARYQWYVWALCGFGYLLDLLWAQAFGLVLSPITQEFGFPKSQSGNISIAFSSGLTAGAFVWGVLVDVIGRRWAFNLTCLFSSVFGLCLGIPNTYTAFLVLTAFVGFGVGGNIPIDTTICLEFIPQNRRFLLALLSVFQPIGVVITSVIAYGFIPTYGCKPDFSRPDMLPSCRTNGNTQPCCSKDNNMGWRYLLYTLGAITLFIFFIRTFIFTLQESPKFWVYKGRDDKAIKVLENIAKTNKRRCNLTLRDFEILDAEDEAATMNGSRKRTLGSGANQSDGTWKEKVMLELDRYKMLFANVHIARLTIVTWLLYICDFFGFTVASYYLPTILAAKNGSLDISLKETYRSYIYIYAPGIVGVLLGSLMYVVPFVGRKYAMVGASGLMGASIFLFSSVNSYASNIGFSVMEYFFQSMFNAVLYGWTPEAFPAPIRGTACGLASFWGRLFGILGPIIAQSLYADSSGSGNINNVLYLAGGVTLGCVLWAFLLPQRSLGGQSM